MSEAQITTLEIDRAFDIPARQVWQAMRWDNALFFADAELFSGIEFKNPPGQWAQVPSRRTVQLIGEGTVDETLTYFDDAQMLMRFELDDPGQYGLQYFEGSYCVEALDAAACRLTNSAKFIHGTRTAAEMRKVWPVTQTTLFDHIQHKLGTGAP